MAKSKHRLLPLIFAKFLKFNSMVISAFVVAIPASADSNIAKAFKIIVGVRQRRF